MGQCQPPIQNALKKTVAALGAEGHATIPSNIDTTRVVKLILRVSRSDAVGDIYRKCALSGEPPMTAACERDGTPISLLEDRELAMKFSTLEPLY